MKRNGAIKCIYDASLFYVHWKSTLLMFMEGQNEET